MWICPKTSFNWFSPFWYILHHTLQFFTGLSCTARLNIFNYESWIQWFFLPSPSDHYQFMYLQKWFLIPGRKVLHIHLLICPLQHCWHLVKLNFLSQRTLDFSHLYTNVMLQPTWCNVPKTRASPMFNFLDFLLLANSFS